MSEAGHKGSNFNKKIAKLYWRWCEELQKDRDIGLEARTAFKNIVLKRKKERESKHEKES